MADVLGLDSSEKMLHAGSELKGGRRRRRHTRSHRRSRKVRHTKGHGMKKSRKSRRR
jgi:hypothetical protein